MKLTHLRRRHVLQIAATLAACGSDPGPNVDAEATSTGSSTGSAGVTGEVVHVGAGAQALGGVVEDPARVWTPQELVAFAIALPPVGLSGECFSYANTNFVLAGMIAEEVAGVSYADGLRGRVLAPAGLMHAFVEEELDAQGNPTDAPVVLVREIVAAIRAR